MAPIARAPKAPLCYKVRQPAQDLCPAARLHACLIGGVKEPPLPYLGVEMRELKSMKRISISIGTTTLALAYGLAMWSGCGSDEISITDVECGPGATMCDGACAVLSHDDANCGTCGTACADIESCVSGTCTPDGGGCGTGEQLCGTVCVNTSSDSAHCGACDSPCAATEVCSGGQCTLTCEAGGGTVCGGECVDTGSNPAHCGGCDHACAGNEVCFSGLCLTSCGLGMAKCDDKCVNLQTSEEHCGSCNIPCGALEDCVLGTCIICDTATTDCDGDGWLVGDNDCCDKSGACGLDPELVNPGAIEVVGNGIDDNCNTLIDLFDAQDTIACDSGLASDSAAGGDYAKALGICRTTEESPAALADKTWGLIDAQLLRADGSALGDAQARSIRTAFGGVSPATLDGQSVIVMSSGIAADGTQTTPGPNGGAPSGSNVSTTHAPSSAVDITTCTDAKCIKDWFITANPPLKAANDLPQAPGCGTPGSGSPETANDSIMLYLRLRAPTNAKAFSFNSYFLSAEYPEFVCTDFNDQLVALVDTPLPTLPVPNPVDKNLMVYNDGTSKWPIGINIAAGTSLFSVCDSQATNPTCWENTVSMASCGLGATQLTGTGFEHDIGCLIGGGSYWLTTSGNIIPGDILELRIVIWDVGDTSFDSLALLDGFSWLSNATLPGTG